jgi:predicted RNA-binding Zn-ribbon protein involved in translation (DUF1610 family)
MSDDLFESHQVMQLRTEVDALRAENKRLQLDRAKAQRVDCPCCGETLGAGVDVSSGAITLAALDLREWNGRVVCPNCGGAHGAGEC